MSDTAATAAATKATAPIVIEKATIQRLIKDITDLVKNPLDADGIYYKHSENDMLVGYAMIVGPHDSLYSGGYYFFRFSFPPNYPYSPPVVSYLTNDGVVRYHPNMYKTQKVCISILNTWQGDQWSACITIRAILLTLMSLLDNAPLLHEPGMTRYSAEYAKYHQIVRYKTISFCYAEMLKNPKSHVLLCMAPPISSDGEIRTTDITKWREIEDPQPYWDYFYPVMLQHYHKNKATMVQLVNGLAAQYPEPIITTPMIMYNMNTVLINYPRLHIELQELDAVLP